MRTPAALWTLAAAASLAACGASPPPAPAVADPGIPGSAGPAGPEASDPPASYGAAIPGLAAGVPDLAAHLRAATRGPQPGDAVVTYAVFAAGAPEPRAETRLTAAVGAAFRSPTAELAPVAARAAACADAVSVTAVPVDAELPLNVDAVVAEAGPLAGAVRAAGQVAFVRYAGRPLGDHAQITGAGLAAVAVARALGGPGRAGEAPVVVDLSTLEAATVEAFAAGLDRTPALQTHVRLVPEERAPGALTLRSRGLARFGKPDLEMGPVAPAALPAAGRRYMGVLEALWTSAEEVRPGRTLGGAALTPCAGPPEAYDLACVAAAP